MLFISEGIHGRVGERRREGGRGGGLAGVVLTWGTSPSNAPG